MSPVFAWPVNDSGCGDFLTFSDTSRGPFSVAPSVSHDQRVPVNLSRSFSRPIDRSIDPIGSTICFFLSLSLSLALSDFSIDYSVRVFRSLFSTSLPALSLAQKLSMEQQEICVRHDRILQLSFVLFCFCAFGYSLSHGSRTEHNGRIVRRIFQLLCMRFVYSSFDDCSRSSASTPSTSFTLHPGRRQRRSFPFLL